MRPFLAIGVFAALTQAPAPNPASPAPFDIYLLPIANGLASLKTALMGKKRGETVSVAVPRGPARKLKITKISAD